MHPSVLLMIALCAQDPVPDAPDVVENVPAAAPDVPVAVPEVPQPEVSQPPADSAPVPVVAPVVDQPTAGSAARWAALATLGAVGALGAVTAATLMASSGAFMLAMLPVLFQRNPLGCACLLLGFLPAQCLVVGATGVVAPLLGAPVAYGAALARKRRVALLPLLVGVAVPTLVGVALGGVSTLVGTVGTCCCLCVTFAGMLSFLQDQYHWDGPVAETYILTRFAPPVLYGGFAVTQLLVLGSMLAGTGMSGALVAFLTMHNGRDAKDTDPVTPDFFRTDDSEPI